MLRRVNTANASSALLMAALVHPGERNARLFKARGSYVHGALERPVYVRDCDEGQCKQEREHEYLDDVKPEIRDVKEAGGRDGQYGADN